jgi:hypothetical protein
MTTQELRKMKFVFTSEELISEIWKPIKNFEEYYEVSSLGRFKSKDRRLTRNNGVEQFCKGKFLKNNYYSNGYIQLILYVNKVRYNFLGHRVIAEHFLTNNLNLEQVNHKNTIKWDNRISNLEWCSRSENMIHAVKNGCFDNHISLKGEDHPNTKLKELDVIEIRQSYVKYTSNEKLFDKFKHKIARSGFDKIFQGIGWAKVGI